jgi:hypothetical protein
MAKYEIKFKHVLEQFYVAEIEAENENEARQLFDDDPFEYVGEGGEPYDEQGLDIIIEDIKKV